MLGLFQIAQSLELPWISVWFSHLTLAALLVQMVHLPQLLPWLKDLCMEVGVYLPYTIRFVMNMLRLMLYMHLVTWRNTLLANNLPLFFSSGPPTVSRILVKFCTAVLQAISSFPVNTIETAELCYTNLHKTRIDVYVHIPCVAANLHRTRIDVYVHIPCVAACSLGHSGSDRSCCACPSNIGSLHKKKNRQPRLMC